MIKLKTFNELKQIRNHEDKELALVEETHKIYQYNQEEDNWIPYESENGLKMSLVDINKMVISQLPDYTEDQIENKRILIDNTFYNSEFYMLLNNDLRYYTVFHHNKDAEETLGEAVIQCAKDWGTIKSIDKVQGDFIEIWVSRYENQDIEVFYLFDYSKGVIECL